MRKYNLCKIQYNDKYGQVKKLNCIEIELRDNTEEHAGYWDVNLGEIDNLDLNEGCKQTFMFEANNGIQLIGTGTLQYSGMGRYCLIGKNINLVQQ